MTPFRRECAEDKAFAMANAETEDELEAIYSAPCAVDPRSVYDLALHDIYATRLETLRAIARSRSIESRERKHKATRERARYAADEFTPAMKIAIGLVPCGRPLR